MKGRLVPFCGLALVACSDGATGRAENGADQARMPASGARSDRDRPVASSIAPQMTSGGQALSGSVSGLRGSISGFDVRRTDTETIVDIAADVLFDFDSASLSTGAPGKLATAAELILQGGTGTVTVAGHTDAKGDEAYNDKLSRDRARAVVTWLSGPGRVPGERLKSEGLGESEPVAANTAPDGTDDEAGRARNRRVTIAIPR